MTVEAIRATFSEWRMVKGRKVLQMVMEVPLEHQEQVGRVLGYPQPDVDLWVGIARITEEAAQRGGRYAQQAGILCNEGAFQKWIEASDAEGAAQKVRDYCGVLSRSHLDTNDTAARKFLDLKADYQNWLRDVA